MLVVAIDPGETFAWAQLDTELRSLKVGECQFPNEISELHKAIPDHTSTVIIERPFKTETTNVIVFYAAGAAMMRCSDVHATRIMAEANRPSFITKRFSCSRRGISQHQFDALCHLAFHFYKVLNLGAQNPAVQLIVNKLGGSTIWTPDADPDETLELASLGEY